MARKVVVFTAGCPLCDEAVQLVRSIACPSCDVQVYDLHQNQEAVNLAKQYGIKRVPAIVVEGKLAECCQTGSINEATLRAMGVGVA